MTTLFMTVERVCDLENTDRYIGSAAQTQCGAAVPGSTSMQWACCGSVSCHALPSLSCGTVAPGAAGRHAGIHGLAAGDPRLGGRASGCPGSCSARGVLGGLVSAADLQSTRMARVRRTA